MDKLSTPAGEYPAVDPIVELLGFRLSTATVLFHAAVAERFGVGVTEMKCYSILRQTGPITAGELGERVGLTTGAITGVVDRLEAAGLARRARDPRDRRRVVLELLSNPERERALLALYEPLGRAISTLVAGYSEAERATLLQFLGQATDVLEAETVRLRGQPGSAS
jgi:DNA-binding MarR family transcriptional regulator